MDTYYPDLIGIPNDDNFEILSNHLDLDNITINKEAMELEIPIKDSTSKLVMCIRD